MNGQQASVQMMSAFDPYFYQMLMNVAGKNIVVQTTKNPIQGLLKSVKPDHIVVDINRTPFYVRIQEIVWVSLA